MTLLAVLLAFSQPVNAQKKARMSLLDSDPDVVYLDSVLKKPIELKVEKAAPVFSDREGSHRLGTLKANQTVKLEAITDKIYRVRGEGVRDGIAGWVAPWAFSSKDPKFVEHLKQLYEREIIVRELIAAKQVAVGMTMDEVAKSKGKPNKTSVRMTEGGQTGRWEYVEYDELKHYVTRIDPVTGHSYRTLSHITQIETGNFAVEFINDVVTAVEESKEDKGGNVRIVVPPVVFGW
jgi:hypothetical protein